MSDWLALETQTITPTCRDNRGQNGAWEEAVRRLREIYLAQSNYYPGVHLALSISRGPVDDVDAGDPMLPPQVTKPQRMDQAPATKPERIA